MLLVSYDPALIALSVLVAIQGGYVSLRLACRVSELQGLHQKCILAIAAITLGGSIWAMHFVGMLALRLPVAVNYDVLLTLVSFLVAILVTGIGLYIASYGPLTRLRLLGAGIFMGLGISIMHYVGMSAVRANCVIDYAPPLVAASVAVGVAASTLALWLAFTPRAGWHAMAGAVIMGLAISGMHYTAMAAATFWPVEGMPELSAPALSQSLLAIVVAVATFIISGFFLLVVLPGRPHTANGSSDVPAAMPAPAEAVARSAESPVHSVVGPTNGGATTNDRLPVQKHGRTLFLETGEIVAIKAEGHYSQVFDGKDGYFCSYSISDLQRRLDPEVFLRVHRSHIINIRHARAFEKEREHGVIHLDGESAHHVPVSRSNLPKLRAALGL